MPVSAQQAKQEEPALKPEKCELVSAHVTDKRSSAPKHAEPRCPVAVMSATMDIWWYNRRDPYCA